MATASKKESENMGEWARLRMTYLKQQRPEIYWLMKSDGTLKSYLTEYQNTYEIRAGNILKKLREERGITEELQRIDPIEWILRDAEAMKDVEEIVKREVVQC